MIVEKINEVKEKKIRQTPQNTWRASMIGHPCLRYLIYERTRWQDKKLHSLDLQHIFDLGQEIEKIAIKDLEEAGFEIYQQQRDFYEKDLNLSGHIDGLIKVDGQLYPIEIKSCSQFVYDTINTYEDLKNSKKPWIKQYPVQLNCYLYFTSKEKGVLLLKNKQTGQYKEIWIDFDWDLMNEVIEKVKYLNECLKNNILPDKINNETCLECNYQHICLPEILNQSKIDFSEDNKLEQMLQRRDELQKYYDEYCELDKEIKEIGRAMKDDITVIGNWIIKREVREYETKPQPPKKIKSVVIKIEKLQQGEEK